MILTPYTLQVLLHFYTTPVKWNNEDSPAYKNAVPFLLAANLIKQREQPAEGESDYITTGRGEAYIHYILSTPLPIYEWKVPERK